MLFSYENPTSPNPYYASIEEMPDYQREKKIEKREAIEGGAFGALFQAAASFIPGVGGAIGKIGAGGINQSLQNRHNSANDYFKSELTGQSHNINATGSLSGMSGGLNNLTQNKGLMQYLQNEMQKNRDNAFSQTALNDGLQSTSQFDKFVPTTENTPNAPDTNPSMPIDLNSTGGSSNFDFSSFGGSGGDFAAPMAGFYRGGLAPLGKDDIALVDTKNGEDTGIRLQAGEMLVVSRKTLSSLNKALSDGDHKEVYDLMKAQVAVAPKVKDGMKGHVDGGKVNTTDPYKDLSDEELAALTKELGIGGKISGDKEKALQQEVKRRGLTVESGGASGQRTALQNWINPALIGKDGKIIAPDEKFDYLKWVDGVKTFNEPKSIKEGTVYNSNLIKDKYSNPSDAKYVGGNWVHANGDPIEDKDLQGQLTKEYFDNQEQKIGASKYVGPYKSPELGEVDNTANQNIPKEKPNVAENKLISGIENKDNAVNPDPFGTQPAPADETPVTDINIKPNDYPLDLTKPNEPEAATGPSGADYAKFFAPQALGTGFDIARGILGFNAANKKLPTFSKPEAWNSYVNRLHGLSETGLTANEMTAATRGIDQTYAYDVDNIRNLSGGNAGMALGNLGRAAIQHYAAQTNLAALNDEARARNLSEYGGVLGADINLNRMIFNDKYSEAQYRQQSGAQLLHDSLSNIKERGNYIQEYQPGSYADQINQLNLQSAKNTNANTDAMQKYYATNPNAFKSPAVSGGGDQGYAKYLALQQQYPQLFQ